jgi:hypothetical protein
LGCDFVFGIGPVWAKMKVLSLPITEDPAGVFLRRNNERTHNQIIGERQNRIARGPGDYSRFESLPIDLLNPAFHGWPVIFASGKDPASLLDAPFDPIAMEPQFPTGMGCVVAKRLRRAKF